MAVTLTVQQLEDALGVAALDPMFPGATIKATIDATRLLPVAARMVLKYAPAAPDGIQNEAVIRLAGWLAGTPPESLASDSLNILGVQIDGSYNTAQTGALRHSGAMSLLSPYKRRRGGLISGTAAL